MKGMLAKFADIHSEKPTVYQSSCDGITNAAQSIKIDSDISGMLEDLSPPNSCSFCK